MNAYDRAMNHLDKAYSFSDNEHQYVSRKVESSFLPPNHLALCSIKLAPRQEPGALRSSCTAI